MVWLGGRSDHIKDMSKSLSMRTGHEQGRPNRSDTHLSSEQEAEIEAKTRDYFNGVVPKRHTKPQRSEYSSNYVDLLSPHDTSPEFVEFQRLQNDPQKLGYKTNEVSDEFVETEYYKDLNCVGKQHHTTGTGFINIDKTTGDNRYILEPDSDTTCHTSCKGNPATNDWVPEAANYQIPLDSGKPRRSDN
ncbi:hypothetical protein FNV43_RR17806 [Rhamnella rubrinervis]|uniref:Maternal effect embryo arrest 59 n=1 Tax=Rhamnella rubrinervis TaxID=2594499 RepID=A0A8K0GVZ6_9ROSA|nr:hypothetical protein FNV43_RR17806 [Rhamnella rubrinervis]